MPDVLVAIVMVIITTVVAIIAWCGEEKDALPGYAILIMAGIASVLVLWTVIYFVGSSEEVVGVTDIKEEIRGDGVKWQYAVWLDSENRGVIYVLPSCRTSDFEVVVSQRKKWYCGIYSVGRPVSFEIRKKSPVLRNKEIGCESEK